MRVIRKPELRQKVGLHPSHIAKLEKAGQFPKRLQLGLNSVGWVEAEIEDWLAQRVAEREQGKAA